MVWVAGFGDSGVGAILGPSGVCGGDAAGQHRRSAVNFQSFCQALNPMNPTPCTPDPPLKPAWVREFGLQRSVEA